MSAVWYILKNKEYTGHLSKTERPERPQTITAKVDDEFFNWLRVSSHNI